MVSKFAEEKAVALAKKLTDNPALFVRLVRVFNKIALVVGFLCIPAQVIKDLCSKKPRK